MQKINIMKRILLILALFGVFLNSYSQDLRRDNIEVEEELTVRDTTIIDLIETHSSGILIDGANGLSKSGNNIEWGGSALNKAVEVLGAGYAVGIGTSGSNIGTFEVHSNDEIYLYSSGSQFFDVNGVEWVLNGLYWINNNTGDTLIDYDGVRNLISASSPYLPTNYEYTFSSTITDSRPGVGFFRLNNATYSSVSKIFIDNFDVNSVDQSDFISLPDTGSYVFISDGTNYINYQITGAITASSSYYKYDVTYINHSGVISGTCNISVDLSNSSGSGGGIDSVLASTSDTLYLKQDSLLATNIVIESRKNITDTLNVNTVLNIDEVGTGNGIHFGDGDTRIVENSDDDLRILAGGSPKIRFNNTNIGVFDDIDATTANTYDIGSPSRFRNIYAERTITDVIETDTVIVGGDTTTGTINLKTAIEAEQFDEINLDTSKQAYSEGTLFYCKDDRVLTFYNDINGFSHNLGYEHVVRFYNQTGGVLTNGTIIRSTGAKVNGSITFLGDLAGIASLDSLQGVAMVTADVPNNSFGIATIMGQVNGLNTSMYSDNQLIYLSHAGTYDTISPEPPLLNKLVGRVVYADADSGAIYFYGLSETGLRPNPDLSVSFTRQTQTITNPGINTDALITNVTNNLYTSDYNKGFTFVGDTISPMQPGVYQVSYSYAFQGDAATGDDWRIGIFINGVELHTVLRTSSSSNKGVVAASKIVSLDTTDWVSLRIINTTNGTRSSIFTDGVINIEYLSRQ